jgi:non-ribosomal peptide synthetase component F
VALFAVLRVGAAYVPLELDHPDERIAAIVEDARPDVILTVSAVSPRLTGDLIELDQPLPEAEPFVTFAPDDPDRLRHPAYTIYTSGSTGKPKGVVTEYAGLTNMLINHQRRIFEPVLAEHDHRVFRIAHTVSFAFDMSWEELLWLADGHEVHICDEELRRDAPRLVEYCLEFGIDVINVTPTYAQQLVAEGLLDNPADGRRWCCWAARPSPRRCGSGSPRPRGPSATTCTGPPSTRSTPSASAPSSARTRWWAWRSTTPTCTYWIRGCARFRTGSR